ncbi:filamentous hemagglutinin family protein, partial [Azospirillum agricola]|uniref:two-partner secretion domain-containing protein n=1 Tax=Azospirillum agricola TaxID=1720247 RepID=UPI001AE6A98B
MTWKGWLSVILSTSSLTSLLVLSGPLSAQTLPTGGGFVAGSGGIATTGATMTVTQQGSRGIVNWNSFSIGQGAKVAFENGSGATLNRVSGGNPSAIAGSLTATGSVYLVNPAGVVVGPTGTVTTGGSFVASTHDVPSDDFMSAKPLTFKGDSTAKVENLGAISSSGGDVLLIAREVSNKGTLSAPNGTAALAGGHEVLLTEKVDSRRGRVLVRAGTGQVDNQGTIAAAQVELRAAGGNIYALAGNNGGAIRATGSANRDGQVWLTAGDGHVQNSGSISAVNADGNGGRIKVATDTSHAAINTGTISVSGATGGKVKVSAGRVSNQGKIKADGATGAGGKVAVKYAKTYVDTAAAETTARGATSGGKVAVTSTAGDSTLFTSGAVDARGATGGGGNIDLFGATINVVGASLNASGGSQGGSIRVGGDYQGSGDMLKAGTVTVTGGATARADASGPTGDGGRIIIWSEDQTSFAGSASARGGTVRGDGGLIEVSSHDTLVFAGLGDAGATNGQAGSLLLDPKNIVISTSGGVTPQFDLVDPNPAASNSFGASVQLLSGGNILVTSQGDDFSASNAGAVYLFNGTTGALISALYGSDTNQALGAITPTTLANGNFVVKSTAWNNGTSTSAGAVTWGSGVTGVAGVVSSSNSLVGSTANDKVGQNVAVLTNGNFVTYTTYWSNGTVASAGAVTWGNGTAGITGTVSAANSLVGSRANDKVGNGVTALTGGGYLVSATSWANGTATAAGALSWGNGTAAVTGVVSATNSLVGSRANDTVGSSYTTLTNGNYVVRSTAWANGTMSSAGAVTWGSGTAGVTGVVSSANSLVGSQTNDKVGIQLTELANGNYVVFTSYWTNGTAASAGAITWADGTAPISGVVSATNSLVGVNANDKVGSSTTSLSNGSYITITTSWNNGTAASAGAVTWGSGAITGTVSSSNSLVGSSTGDKVGTGITGLTNGNYVVKNIAWANGTATSAGAVTWGSGTAGVTGVVSTSNSLVGSTVGDTVGIVVLALSNGNYVVGSSVWSNGTAASAGAATWMSGTGGGAGVVSSANSLVGTAANDKVGVSLTELANGNYLVTSSATSNGTATNAGSVTWGDGTIGVTGAVSTTNSLMGSSTGDAISGVTTLSNGNYLVTSTRWSNGTSTYAGAVTWGNGSTGVTGTVSSSNSLVGSSTNDRVGIGTLALNNGNYVVRSSLWSYNGATSAGAVTWGDGTIGVTGVVSTANSIVGTTANDRFGNSLTALTNGNYLIVSSWWSNGTVASAGVVTWGNGTAGATGVASASNSLVGSSASDKVGNGLSTLANGNYLVLSAAWVNSGATSAGAVTWGNGTAGVTGVVSSTNSLVGSQANDRVGTQITTLANGNYILRASTWSNGTVTSAGAVTWGNGTAGVTGVVSSANSLVGTSTGALSTLAGTNGTYLAYSSLQGVGGRIMVGVPVSGLTYATASDRTVTIQPDAVTAVLNTGTALTLQANNDITVSSDIIVNNPIGNGGAFTLSAGRSILLNANITTDNGDFTAIANAKASAGVVDAQRDSGAAVITMASGKAIDAGTGAIALTLDTGAGNTNTASGAITLGSLTGGTITVDNAGPDRGDIAINSGAVLAASGSGNALVLAASSGGNFVNNGDSTVLSTPNGRWLVYSADPALNTLGGLTGTAQYSITYSGTPPGSVTGTGSQLLYSSVAPIPANTLTFSALDTTITYGDALPTYSYSYSGLAGTDTLSAVVTGTPTLRSTAASGSGVGTYTITIDLSGVSINSGYTSAYTLGSVTATLTIVAKTLTATGSRVYDGTTAASGLSLSGVVGGDAVSIGGSGAVADKNVGTGKTVTGLSLTGGDSGNYTLGGATLDITAKTLTATGGRVYDGTTAASDLSLSGVVGGDAVSIGGSGAVADKNVGTGKTV